MYRGNCIDNDAEDNFDAAADDDDNDDESLQEISLSLSFRIFFIPLDPHRLHPGSRTTSRFIDRHQMDGKGKAFWSSRIDL